LAASLFDTLHPMWPDRLTVLAYHRIGDPNAPGFDTFKPNLSATPAAFAAQMDFIYQRFNVISGSELVAWLQGQHTLPPHPALITFDDGYRDNFECALPILQQRNLPAIIFLATDYIGNSAPFYYDLAAYCFHHTRQGQADLPLVGWRRWKDKNSQAAILADWLIALKKLPDDEKRMAIKQLPPALGVIVPPDAFAKLYLTWDHVCAMMRAGIEMGAHTQSHPILTRVRLEQARAELAGSRARIEAETGRTVTTFAYPNGLPTDFNSDIQDVLQQVGFKAAFTLIPGPAWLAEVQESPLAIRRVHISRKDTLPRFAAKIMGLPRLLGYRASGNETRKLKTL
jgi:peptidoglycan/xylan/chitin deacetylase (PgdA/CDA1 family)